MKQSSSLNTGEVSWNSACSLMQDRKFRYQYSSETNTGRSEKDEGNEGYKEAR